MKKFIGIISILLVAVLAAATFASCGDEDSSKSGKKKSSGSDTTSSSASSNNSTSSKPFPPSSDSSSNSNSNSNSNTDSGDLVSTVKECTAPFSGSFLSTGETGLSGYCRDRLPKININSSDADSINQEIESDYLGEFDYISKMDSNAPGARLDYVYYVNGNVLSLIIEVRSVNTPNSHFSVYNVDINSGSALSKSEVAAKAGLTEDGVNSQLKNIIEAKFSSIGDDSFVLEQKEKTLSDDNIDAAMFFLDGSGNLRVAYRYYWIAGADNYGEIAKIG